MFVLPLSAFKPAGVVSIAAVAVVTAVKTSLAVPVNTAAHLGHAFSLSLGLALILFGFLQPYPLPLYFSEAFRES